MSVNNKVTYPQRGDFLVDERILFEVGGQNKTIKQIADFEKAFVAADDIEYSSNHKIPLWLFGFFY